MFTSRPSSHVSRVECGGTPEAHGAREIIGDAILRFRNQQELKFVRSSHFSMTTFTILQFTAAPRSGSRPRVVRHGVPFGARGGDVCGYEKNFAERSDFGAKCSCRDAWGYRGIPGFMVGVEAASRIALGDRLSSGRIGAGPDTGRSTP